MGLSLIAAGASVPDAITSLLVAQDGKIKTVLWVDQWTCHYVKYLMVVTSPVNICAICLYIYKY